MNENSVARLAGRNRLKVLAAEVNDRCGDGRIAVMNGAGHEGMVTRRDREKTRFYRLKNWMGRPEWYRARRLAVQDSWQDWKMV